MNVPTSRFSVARTTSGGINCGRGCVPDQATLDACVNSLADHTTDEYPVATCTYCDRSLKCLAVGRGVVA